jgi:hypothetical protein
MGGQDQVEHVLEKYGGFTREGSRLHRATSLGLDKHPQIILTPQSAVRLPASVRNAVDCWWHAIAKHVTEDQRSAGFPDSRPAGSFGPLPAIEREPVAPELEEFLDDTSPFEEGDAEDWERWLDFEWAMNESGSVVVYGGKSVSFAVFMGADDQVRPDTLRLILAGAEHACSMLGTHVGTYMSVQLDWASLTPERFEELCYDVLLRCGHLREDTIRKHGKTRSRDGGRDVEAWTLGRFNKPSRKWIYQCKLVTSDGSLSGSKVNVADVIDQYSASGFGVMTSVVIDSTLYDKLDAIAARRSVEIDLWDGRRLERFLASRPDLLLRYFPKQGAKANGVA